MPSDSTSERTVVVGFDRIEGWLGRFESRHPSTVWTVTATTVSGAAADGSTCSFEVPYPPLDDLTIDGLVAHLSQPRTTALVLVRKGGFAVARLVGEQLVATKIGQRHVQGRSKAGGWSQQRFARRRDNQARDAFVAAAGHVERLLGPVVGDVCLLGLGGDRAAVDAVLGLLPASTDRALAQVPRVWLGAYPDPKRATLDAAVSDLRSIRLTVTDTLRI